MMNIPSRLTKWGFANVCTRQKEKFRTNSLELLPHNTVQIIEKLLDMADWRFYE
jgi:hypothetical protein